MAKFIIESNETRLPDALVLAVARFVAPPLGPGTVHLIVEVHPTHAYQGRAWGFGRPRRVRLRLGAGHHFPYRSWSGQYTISAGPVPTQREALVGLLAHELHHLWQARRWRRYSEGASRSYAVRQVERWRRRR